MYRQGASGTMQNDAAVDGLKISGYAGQLLICFPGKLRTEQFPQKTMLIIRGEPLKLLVHSKYHLRLRHGLNLRHRLFHCLPQLILLNRLQQIFQRAQNKHGAHILKIIMPGDHNHLCI